MKIVHACLALQVACLAGACASAPPAPFPEPVRPPRELPQSAGSSAAEPPADAQSAAPARSVPAPAAGAVGPSLAEGTADRLGAGLAGGPVAEVAFHDAPLAVFINEVFGETLGLSFVIAPGLRDKTDLVTLRLRGPVAPEQLFNTARDVLRNYGVDIREQDGVLTFVVDADITAGDIPLLVSGRALPDVPATHRAVFQLVPLRIVSPADVRDWLEDLFEGQNLTIRSDPDRQTVLLQGTADLVARALAMIDVLDQPLLRGRHGAVIQPTYMDAENLAEDLAAVLKSQGYSTTTSPGSSGATMLLPLKAANKLVVFAPDRATLGHVEDWVETLDVAAGAEIEDAVFTYRVRNMQAESLVDTLNKALGVVAEEARGVVFDRNSNVLIFRGSGADWAQILNVVRTLDRPVPSVLIEVLIAEILLTDEYKSGFEFLAEGAVGRGDFSVGTLNRLG